jgi:extradiol dioxygenase family protein
MPNFRKSSDRRSSNFRSPRQDSERGSYRPNQESQDGERGSFRSDSRSSSPKKRPSWELPQFEGQKKFFKKPFSGSKPFGRDRHDRDEGFSQDSRETSSRPSWSGRPNEQDRQERGNSSQDYRSQGNGFGRKPRSNDDNFSRDYPRKDRSQSRGSFSDSRPRFRDDSSNGFKSKPRFKENFSHEKSSNFNIDQESNKSAKKDYKPSTPPFHIAIPVNDLVETRKFYSEILGFREGRSSDRWIDWNCFGHQIVTHLRPNKIDSRSQEIVNQVDEHGVPVPHFGVILQVRQFEKFSQKLKELEVKFVIEPYLRFEGEAGEQLTMFFYDPSGNAFEFKAFKDISQLFHKKNDDKKIEIANNEISKTSDLEEEITKDSDNE